MKRIDIISVCGDCSNRRYDGNVLICGETLEPTTDSGHIPDSCPLPAEEPAPSTIHESSEEVKIEYDHQAYDVVERMGKLLKSRGLKLEERWVDTSLYLKIIEREK